LVNEPIYTILGGLEYPIHVVNIGGYIGESTKREIEFAKQNNKIISYEYNLNNTL